MKLFLLPIVLLFSINVFAKNYNISPKVIDAFEEATIHFHDGTSIKGFGKITSNFSIKFKTSKDAKPDLWTELMLKGITLHREFNDIDFLYIKVKCRKTIKLLEVIELGEISIFAEAGSPNMPFTVFFNLGGSGSTMNDPLLTSQGYNREVSFYLYAKKKMKKP